MNLNDFLKEDKNAKDLEKYLVEKYSGMSHPR